MIKCEKKGWNTNENERTRTWNARHVFSLIVHGLGMWEEDATCLGGTGHNPACMAADYCMNIEQNLTVSLACVWWHCEVTVSRPLHKEHLLACCRHMTEHPNLSFPIKTSLGRRRQHVVHNTKYSTRVALHPKPLLTEFRFRPLTSLNNHNCTIKVHNSKNWFTGITLIHIFKRNSSAPNYNLQKYL